uniref:hypothetical protein n=1 Tax=Spirosoma sp. TaxID=1899569 RepID=UPI003B3B6948
WKTGRFNLFYLEQWALFKCLPINTMKSLKRALLVISLGWLGNQLTSCRQETRLPEPTSAPTHRPTAITVFYINPGKKAIQLGTIDVSGVNYGYSAIDSTTYRYDKLGRQLSRRLVQRQASETTPKTALLNEVTYQYTYAPTTVIEQTPSQRVENPLDASQLRYASYSQTYFDRFQVLVDTLRHYSAEGILVSSTTINRSVNPVITKRACLVDQGDVVKISLTYGQQSDPYEVTTLSYDRSHYGPLTTQPLDGETSRHALLTKVVTSYWGRQTDRSSFTYRNEYDQQGRLVQRSESFQPANGQPTELRSLTRFYY